MAAAYDVELYGRVLLSAAPLILDAYEARGAVGIVRAPALVVGANAGGDAAY